MDDTKTQTPQQACTNMHTLKPMFILTLYNTQAFTPHILARVTQGQKCTNKHAAKTCMQKYTQKE